MKRILLLLSVVAIAVTVYRILGHEDSPMIVGHEDMPYRIVGHEDMPIRLGGEGKTEIVGHEDIQI